MAPALGLRAGNEPLSPAALAAEAGHSGGPAGPAAGKAVAAAARRKAGAACGGKRITGPSHPSGALRRLIFVRERAAAVLVFNFQTKRIKLKYS